MIPLYLALLATILNLKTCANTASFIEIPKNQKLHNLEKVFVHRDAWFNICDFAYTPPGDPWIPTLSARKACNPENIPAGSLIFATPHGIEEFLEKIHPKIKNPYILITLFYGPVLNISKYVHDPKIIAWFGQANRDAITFEKFTLIPLGIMGREDLFNQKEQLNIVFTQLRNAAKPKLLYMNFTIHEGRAGETEYRRNIFNIFKDKPFCSIGKQQPFLNYIHDAAQHKFILSPFGDMCDCYRHWESLLVGSIPILQRSPLDDIFKDLPVIIVDDYNEVTEDFLHAKYQEMQYCTYNFRKLYMQYWVDKIHATRSHFFKTKGYVL